MKISRKALAVVLVACVLAGIALAQSWRIISEIYRGTVQVTKAQLLRIYPDASTPFPSTMITGQAFKISVNVENPNPVTIKGKIMLNFTKPSITLNDVDVYSDARYRGYQLDIRRVGVYGDTLVFTIQVNYIHDPYFSFEPGLNANVTYFYVQFNAEGEYSWALAVYQG